jgi:murein DD-endopeptidase MepM/ murein hydrolase activator NlpD
VSAQVRVSPDGGPASVSAEVGRGRPGTSRPWWAAVAGDRVLRGVLALAWAASMTAAPPPVEPSQASDRSEGISAVVPGGQLGEYRHGTYPSRGNRTHVGVDVVAPCGTPVLAIEDGTIVDRIRSRADPDFASLGYMAIVEHPASVTGRTFYSLYLHLEAPPVAGEHVERGARLGRVGATGRATGCHLHLEVRYFRARVSPVWKHIYGPGDQRTSPHFREKWEDPVAFVAQLEGRRQGLRSRGPGQG